MHNQYKIIARMWYCSDICGCYKPEVYLVNSENFSGRTIWEGEFFSGDYKWMDDAQKELEEAAKKYNISLKNMEILANEK